MWRHLKFKTSGNTLIYIEHDNRGIIINPPGVLPNKQLTFGVNSTEIIMWQPFTIVGNIHTILEEIKDV
jgi:hypothetical protein